MFVAIIIAEEWRTKILPNYDQTECLPRRLKVIMCKIFMFFLPAWVQLYINIMQSHVNLFYRNFDKSFDMIYVHIPVCLTTFRASRTGSVKGTLNIVCM